MGLDMYLSVKKYVSQKDGYGPEAVRRPEYDAIVKAAGLDKFANHDSVSIYGVNVGVTAAYWRKANQIHKWFVDNCQNGVDECQEVYVSIDQLKELRSVCAEVLLNKDDKVFIEDTLPPQSGFFFGTEDIDEWYFSDVQYTYDRLGELLELLDNKDELYTVTYQSSW